MATPALSLSHQHVSAFAADVRESLTKPGQRELPSKYLYDEVGSALFETICVLPEYGLTRADARLLEKYSGEIVGRLPSPIQVAELGSGSGKKTRWILELLWRPAKKNLGRSTWLASWGTNSHIWKDYMLSPKGGDHRIICLCFSWEARLAISIAMRAMHFFER